MGWGRVLLIAGCVVGTLVAAFGALALLAGLTDQTLSSSDRNDTVVGAVFILGVGLALLLPCAVLLIVLRPKPSLPIWQAGPYRPAAPPALPGAAPAAYIAPAQPDAIGTYLQWFGWCQREIGGDTIALHAAAMAALARAAAGDSAGAQQVARQSIQARPGGVAAGRPPKIRGAKVKLLARIGAATLPLLEPGETVVVSLYGTDRQAQMWQLAFGIIGYLISASQTGAYYVTVTDRRVLALTGPQLTKQPDRIAFLAPRSMVTGARFRRGVLADSFWLSRVTGEQNRLRLTRLWRPEAGYAEQVLAPGGMPTPLPRPG